MSAVATPPAVPHADTRGPMRGLPPIPRMMTVTEAQAKRQKYVAPDVMCGEPCFYRRQNDQNECIGWITKTSNRAFTVIIARPGYTHEEKTSVAYWDHTLPNPAETGDPMAAYNNNGSFRRTPFFMKLAESAMVSSAKKDDTIMEMLAAMQAEIDKLKASGSDGTRRKQ